MKKLGLLACVVFIVGGCIRTKEEIAPWQLKPIPVVYSLLTPDSTVTVFLTNTYTGKKNEPFQGAKAFVAEENGVETELVRYDSIFTDSLHKIKVEAGKKYKLRINLENGLEVKAETTVPKVAAVFSEYLFIPIDTLNNSQLSAYFKSKWTTPPANNPTDDYRLYTSWNWDVDVVKTSAVDYSATDTHLVYPTHPGNYTISLLTTDVWLSRLLINKQHVENSMLMGTDIGVLLAAEFKGVLPNFSNISNGVGLFGSYLIHTRDLQGNIIK